MKILVLTNWANGLWLFRKELLKSFMDAGHIVLISVPYDENCKKLEKYCTRLIDTHLERHGINPFKDIDLFHRYYKLLQELKPDVVLTYTVKPNIYGGCAARLQRIPYICNITGLGMGIENGGIMSKILVALYRGATKDARRVFFQNERNRKFMQERGVAVKNSGLLPGSGVNLDEHPFRGYPLENEGIHILAVIRVMKDKGTSEYLEAAERIAKTHDNVHFDLVSEYEEDERAFYEPWITRLENEGILTYHGHVDYVEPYMDKCHIVVHPSYHEGMSNVLLEADACGRPILCSDIHGCIEALDGEKNGFAFEPKSTDALVAAIERILALSEKERAKMGRAGRRFIENNFDRKLIIDAYKAELDSISENSQNS
ncbi:glycosyltransferase family 4 protein [Butyrivibrio sp. VCD2006]|uniref:glycosyltransferase family 4 protein n=1 Tax=Butyrivibrio sp. VCD2006 TaxID=1280664 RepID=UPI000426E216|nr:glycosyltransferase family 4 protein [Butyrivibrio sp. VCD2006]